MNLRTRSRSFVAFTLTLVLLFVSLTTTQGQRRANSQAQSASSAQRPRAAHTRLIMLIVVDQFRYDYLARFGDLFDTGGLRRLMREGASWANANYDHVPTYTAPGHATLMTGAWPAETGIIANEWPDRDTGQNVTSVSDSTAKALGGVEGESAASPRRLMASTLGDELRVDTNDRSKVIGIALKDRSAILPAGRHASAAYWFSINTGAFISSNYYFNQLPAWVTKFNDSHPADKFYGAKWERLLPEAEYLRRAGPDAPAWEKIEEKGETNTFPHVITGGAPAPNPAFYDALEYSPFASDLLVNFAKQALTNASLGQDDDTDLLSVSFSSNDYVGHRYGPQSQEVMDITLRVDRQIAELLDAVNARVGLQNTLVVFTADHGVGLVPEQASLMGLPGGRVSGDDVMRAVRNAIRARYSKGERDTTADYIQKFGNRESFFNNNLYFNIAALKRDGVNLDEIERIAGEAAMTVPGVKRYFTRAQLESGAVSPADPLARRVLHGFYARRSGDLIIIQDPYKYLGDSSIAATHGSPYSYDTHVPLIIMGRGIKAGRYLQDASPADIAPTLAALLDVQAPSNAVGRVLTEAIAVSGGER